MTLALYYGIKAKEMDSPHTISFAIDRLITTYLGKNSLNQAQLKDTIYKELGQSPWGLGGNERNQIITKILSHWNLQQKSQDITV